jgi:transcriptional regulator with XRE-family HTH domain
MEKDINKIVWEKIKTLRKGLGFTQIDFWEKIGLSRTRITQLELWSQSPTLNTLKLVADWLDVEIRDLFN